MSWKAIPNGSEVDLVGPVGDTLEVEITSTGDDYTWNGWAWHGQVRATPGASTTVGTFSFVDTSTSSTLTVTAAVAASTTDDWTAGDTLVYAIQGTKSGTVVTFVQGRIVPQESIVR